MVIQFIPTIVRIGTQLGPVLLNEVAKPRFRKFLKGAFEQGAEFAFKAGKRRLRKNKPRRTNNTFIMRRGRKRFQCRKVN